MKPPFSPVFCAIDTVDMSKAINLTAMMAKSRVGIKLGLEFFNTNGIDGVHVIQRIGVYNNLVPVFLDLKFHDIPITVAKAVRSVMPLQPFMLNVHASGGRTMLQAAVSACAEEADKAGIPRPRLVAVTVLTSLDNSSMKEIGIATTIADQVQRLADLAQICGLDGVICSGHEVRRLRASCGHDFCLVVAGVRPTWSNYSGDDQARVLTPAGALAEGADVLIIGRPITFAPDPVIAVQKIIYEITEMQRLV